MPRLHPVSFRDERRTALPRRGTKTVGKIRRHAPYPRRWTDVYVLSVGNAGESVDDWSRYLKDMTGRRGWSVARLARQAGINRSTIFEWMRWGGESLTVASVLAVARGLDADPRTALLAAGNVLHLDESEDAGPEIGEILVSGLPDDVQQALIEEVIDERKRDLQNRLTNVRRMIRLAGGEAS